MDMDGNAPGRPALSQADIKAIVDMLKNLKRQLDGNINFRSSQMAVQEIKVDWDLGKNASQLMTLENPARAAAVVVTAAMVQKAAFAAGVTTDSRIAACASAAASLTTDVTLAAALGPETAGLGSIVPLAFAAWDAYSFGKNCFVVDGKVSHAVKAAHP